MKRRIEEQLVKSMYKKLRKSEKPSSRTQVTSRGEDRIVLTSEKSNQLHSSGNFSLSNMETLLKVKMSDESTLKVTKMDGVEK